MAEVFFLIILICYITPSIEAAYLPDILPLKTHNLSCINHDNLFPSLEKHSSSFPIQEIDSVVQNFTFTYTQGLVIATAQFLPTSDGTCFSTSGNSPIDNHILTNVVLQLERVTTLLNSISRTCTCKELLTIYPNAESGFYKLLTSNGHFSTAYCDMEGNNCNDEGGWMRVAFINMSDPKEDCPSALQQHIYPNLTHSVCGRPKPSGAGCISMSFSSYGVNYTTVCGRIRGYQFNSNDGFYPNVGGSADINGVYVDGYSITYGNPRQHIWSYACGLEQHLQFGIFSDSCPCNQGHTNETYSPPAFVGNDSYYCESALPVGQQWTGVLYADDPLWDGEQCISDEVSCCTNPNLPWFLKSLGVTTNSDIEVRLCGSQPTYDEDTPFDLLELYVQ